MSIRDFVKKHKGKLAAASGALASLLAISHLAEKSRRSDNRRRVYQDVAANPREYGYEYAPVVEDVGLGKKRRSNSLLKAVQAYKKKHGCSLKEAWAAVRQ
jgi:hypothetical protein